MGALFDSIPGEAKKGKEFVIRSKGDEVFFVSETDEIFCFAGIMLRDDKLFPEHLNTWPYYMNGKHSTDLAAQKQISGFKRISDGRITLERYVDEWLENTMYKQIDAYVRLPSADTYYAVYMGHKENEALTRAVFGLTYDEMSQLLECYAQTVGIYSEYIHYPRLTRSVRSVNFCDITESWIPAKFPYVTFAESGYEFSHVSLWGFYRHVQLLTKNSMKSVFAQVLLNEGIAPNILENLFKIGRQSFFGKTITHNILPNV